MALDADRRPPALSFSLAARELWQRSLRLALPVLHRAGTIAKRVAASKPMRPITGSLLRRIIVSNLLGLLILIGGILYFSQHNVWLIDAKRESLKSQGEIIAAAIAANATVETERIVIDPDRLPEVSGSLVPFRDDGFASLQLSIRPERVAPVLRRMVQPTENRARIYGRDGTLVADSAQLLSRGQITRQDAPKEKPNTKNLWTRITQWFLSADLPVYREIGSANGNAYPEVRMAMTGATTPMLLLNQQGEQIVSVAIPIQRARSVQGVLLLSTKPGEIDDALGQERWTIFKTSLLALAAMIATSLLLSRTVAGPMRRLSAAAERVSRSMSVRHVLPDYSQRSDEVGQMAASFGRMTAALYRRIEASEKFAADVAHELKNPLTAARSTAESLSYARTEEQRQQLIYQIQSELKRLNRLITDVSNASRLDAELALQLSEPVPLAKVLQGIVDTFGDILSDTSKSIALEISPSLSEDSLVVSGHEGRLAQVITNLIDNAISFSPEGGTVLVRARRLDGFVEFCVEDDGPGIDPEKLEQIFNRFYTYRPTAESSRGNNSGLGLSISREIVLAHGGEVWAENRLATGPGAAQQGPLGARFTVRLPAAQSACAPSQRTSSHRVGARA
jgi:two-component system, OmpR family, sensor histidine kinase ChvG